MKTIFLLIINSCSVLSLLGQSTDSITVRKNEKGIVEYVKFPSFQSSESEDKVTVPETAKDFFAEYIKPTTSTSFILQPQKQRNKDFRHEHYDQYYNEVKVDGAGYNFHFENGRMYLAHGNYIKIDGLKTTPSITKDGAKQAFARYKKIPVEEVTGFMADLVIKEISEISGKDTVSTPVLVYRIYLITGHPNNGEVGYIGAQAGKVLTTEPSMTGYSATGTLETRYSGTKQAITQRYNNTFNLCDSSRNAVIHTWNLNGSTNTNDREELTDADNNWTAAEYASNEDDMGLDIHWVLQEIYDYFFDEYSISSFDNDDTAITAYFHFGIQDFAGWNFVENLLVFGNGNTLFKPVASLDAVAHEYGHGITDFQIGWGITGDPYAFNEGMSDIWAVILENRILSNSIWKIGEEIILSYSCLRNLQNPEDPSAETEISDTYLSTKYNDNSVPGDVPYIKGGVFSHWFFLLVNGGRDTNDNNDDYTVYGIGMDAAEELVVEAVFNNYLDNTSTYPQIRTAMVNAANSLFGTNSFQSLQVANAWYAVGVGSNPGQVTIAGPDLICLGGSTFTAGNLPTGSTMSGWSTSSNLEVKSGGGTSSPTIKAKTSSSIGNGWLQVNFTSNGYTSGARKTVWVGAPRINEITGPMYAPNGQWATYHAVLENDFSSPTDYTWILNPLNGNSVYDYGDYVDIAFYNSGSYQLLVQALNTCSTPNFGPYYGTSLYVYDSKSLSISPNPSNGEVTIAIESTDEKELLAADTEEWDLEVYDNGQNLKEKKTKLKGKSTKIQTQGWQEGVYVVRVKYKDEILTDKLVVKK